MAAQPLRDYPLVVNVAISENRALAHWHILALIIGLGTLLVSLCSALLIRALGQQFRRLAASEAAFVEKSKDPERANETIDIALQNMPQGLIMFDEDRRFVICNERYARMYDLPPELMTPGRAVEDILQYRVATKTFSGGWVRTHFDVTERNRVNAEIAQSRENLAYAEAIAHVGHFQLDFDLGTVIWSDEAYRIYGKSRAPFTPTADTSRN